MVWGIERAVWLATGTPLRRDPAERGGQTHALARRSGCHLAGACRATGRGEASSGLDWDRIVGTS